MGRTIKRQRGYGWEGNIPNIYHRPVRKLKISRIKNFKTEKGPSVLKMLEASALGAPDSGLFE